MISIEKKFLFIHIPKTGGNSIQTVLQNHSDDKIVIGTNQQNSIERFGIENEKYNYRKHSTLSIYKKELDAQLYSSMYKFAVVRNPWDRMISYYFSPHRGKTKFNRKEFSDLIEKTPVLGYYTTEYNTFERIINKFGLFNNLDKPLDSKIDFYLRFENLEDDFRILCKKIDVPFEQLPKYNMSEKEHYSRYYDLELINKVSTKFKQEIDFFNYSFEENKDLS